MYDTANVLIYVRFLKGYMNAQAMRASLEEPTLHSSWFSSVRDRTAEMIDDLGRRGILVKDERDRLKKIVEHMSQQSLNGAVAQSEWIEAREILQRVINRLNRNGVSTQQMVLLLLAARDLYGYEVFHVRAAVCDLEKSQQNIRRQQCKTIIANLPARYRDQLTQYVDQFYRDSVDCASPDVDKFHEFMGVWSQCLQ